MEKKRICKNCWFYHKKIKQCRLCRSTEAADVGMSVSKYDTCDNFIKGYKSYQCQKCGKPIGWLGRFIEAITFKLISHECNKK